MSITCPQCGSANIKRLPGLAANGWNFIKAGFFIFLLAIVLPISMGPVMAMAIVGMLLFGLGVILTLAGAVSGRKSEWSWECQACKKEFKTKALE